ncbi:MAG: hypothetical protein C4527_19845 [Candidatus Omnitrophota bacterium]|jgi:hypothetical protein|nr:MAG: hypothetical protein C4527_19845 [Candidatus Omnitrophota bacterium]
MSLNGEENPWMWAHRWGVIFIHPWKWLHYSSDMEYGILIEKGSSPSIGIHRDAGKMARQKVENCGAKIHSDLLIRRNLIRSP